MSSPAVSLRDLVAASKPRRREDAGVDAPAWTRAQLAGRLTEISGRGASAATTLAVTLVLDAQRHAEPAAWITTRESSFFPPDVAEHGVDLDALAVVRVPRGGDVPRAADKLLRSGAFGLVVMDLDQDLVVPAPLLARLVGLAERHDAALVAITRRPRAMASLSSLVSLRVDAHRERLGDGRFAATLTALRDKRRPPGWTLRQEFRAPEGCR